jgi:hypothetical protein
MPLAAPRRRRMADARLLVAPVLMGDDRSLPFYRARGFAASNDTTSLKLVAQESLERDHLWLRYEVVR